MAKSKALHNFNLPQQLNWRNKESNSAISRTEQSKKRDPPLKSEGSRKSEGGLIKDLKNCSANSTFDSMRNRVYSSNPDEKKLEEERENPNPQAKRMKIEHKDDEGHKEVQSEEKNNKSKFDEEQQQRIWNLRPRGNKLKVSGGESKSDILENNKVEKIGEKEVINCSKNGGLKKIKLNINIALTKREIEKDIFALTGAKPARRPMKRARNVQNQLDAVFPGLGLVSITQDSYKVSENYMKDWMR